MNQKLRNDGNFIIYKVEVLQTYSSGPTWNSWEVLYHDDKLPVPSIPVRYANVKDRAEHKQKEPFASWGAGGKCWQETGIYGFFDRSKADKLVELLLKHNPDKRFRLVEQQISQHTRVVAVLSKPLGKHGSTHCTHCKNAIAHERSA